MDPPNGQRLRCLSTGLEAVVCTASSPFSIPCKGRKTRSWGADAKAERFLALIAVYASSICTIHLRLTGPGGHATVFTLLGMVCLPHVDGLTQEGIEQ